MTDVLSVVVPVLNGAHLVPHAHAQLVRSLEPLHRPFELVFVDDGSTDGTWATIAAASSADPRVRGARLAENVGQAAAIAVGVRRAVGSVVATIDVDLETEPDDLALVVGAVDAGAEVASGRRTSTRRWHREVPSQAFNLYGRLTGIPLHDVGCGTNAMSRRAADAYGAIADLRRELPTAALVTLCDHVVEVPLRSRRPEGSQLGYRDLAWLWLAFEARRGTGLRSSAQAGLAAALLGAAAVARGPGVRLALGAAGALVLLGPGAAGRFGRRRVAPAAPRVIAETGG